MRIQLKKSLGQNFLIDQNIRSKILASLELKPSDIILEIGAGSGELTGLIAAKVNKIFSLEIDRRLLEHLSETLGVYNNVEVINQDILKFDLGGFLKERRVKGKIKVFGNIPYYISSPIIQRLFEFRDRISAIYISVQKEFGQRVAASPGPKDYGSFSCFVQYYATPRIIFNISKNSFKPAPKVDSSFLELKVRDKPPVYVKDETAFFKIIRAAFNQRRKTLRNSLSAHVPEKKLGEFFKVSGLDSRVRPEELSLSDFAALANLAAPLLS